MQKDIEKLFRKIASDKNTIEVKEVVEVFVHIFDGVIAMSESFSPFRERMTTEEQNKLINCLTNSFLSSLWVTASKDERQFKERIAYVEEINKDVLIKKADA